ncbi:MAG: hypothetical protein ABL955_07715 [Elusimicrobiota bacterium]
MKTILGLILALTAVSQAAEELITPDPFKRAEVVLRVSKDKLGNGACDKYCWPDVKILKVLKNTSKEKFPKGAKINVAVLGTSRRFPPGQFTIYLERYNTAEEAPNKAWMWKLLDGSTEMGLSHITALPPRTDCKKGTRPFTGLSGVPGCCPESAVCD